VAEGPAFFFFDLASPDAYLLAERVLSAMPVATEWIPVLASGLPGAERYDAFRCEHERDIVLGDFVAAARRRGLQPLRWPEPFPFDSELAMRAATYARQIGRTVASGGGGRSAHCLRRAARDWRTAAATRGRPGRPARVRGHWCPLCGQRAPGTQRRPARHQLVARFATT
jgi:hypothetical protein